MLLNRLSWGPFSARVLQERFRRALSRGPLGPRQLSADFLLHVDALVTSGGRGEMASVHLPRCSVDEASHLVSRPVQETPFVGCYLAGPVSDGACRASGRGRHVRAAELLHRRRDS